MPDAAPPVLRIQGMDAFYGKSRVLHGVDLTVAPGDVLAVVGRNGAGKTTLMSAVVGLLRRSTGTVQLHGRDMSSWAPHRRVRAGLGYVPAAARLFRSLTVAQNLVVAAPRGSADEQVDRALELFPPLRGLADRRAGALSGGERQMVAIARAMVREPRLLLLDEPTEGLSPLMVDEVSSIIRSLADAGMTMVLCEQNTSLVDRAATRVAVIEKGRLVLEHAGGAPDYRRYLGVA